MVRVFPLPCVCQTSPRRFDGSATRRNTFSTARVWCCRRTFLAQWADVKEQRLSYLAKHPSVDFRLIAFRAAGLPEAIKSEISEEPWACVLWIKGGTGSGLRESD